MSEDPKKATAGEGCGCVIVVLLGAIIYVLSWGFEHILKHLHTIEGLMHR